MLFKEKYMEMICVYIYTCFSGMIHYMLSTICTYVCIYIYGKMLMFFLQKRLGEAFGKVMVNISCWQS